MHIIYDIKSKIASELAGFRFDSSSWQLKLSTAQNVFSKFRPGWWQFCWMTGVKFKSIQSILVRFLHITQFTVCAAKNLTVFVADSPRCLEWSSMVAAVSRALRDHCESTTLPDKFTSGEYTAFIIKIRNNHALDRYVFFPIVCLRDTYDRR